MTDKPQKDLKGIVRSRVKGLGLDALFHQVDLSSKDGPLSSRNTLPESPKEKHLLQNKIRIPTPGEAGKGFKALWETAFHSGSPARAGIVLGSGAFKWLEVKTEDSGLALLRATYLPVPHIMTSTQEKWEAFVCEQAQNTIDPQSIKKISVTSILSRQQVIIKFLSLPTQDKNEVAKMLEFEAEHLLPFPLYELEYDFHILGQKDNETQLLLVAAKKEDLGSHLRLLNKIGIRVDKIQVSSLTLYNAGLASLIHKGLTLQVHIGSVSTDINIVRDGLLTYTRAISWGSRDLSQQLTETCHVDFDNAEQIKRDNGILLLKDTGNETEQRVSTAAKLWADQLVAELNRTLQHFHLEKGLGQIDRVVLTGGGARLNNLNEYLRGKLGIKTVELKASPDLCRGPAAQGFENHFPELNSLLGALAPTLANGGIDINLLPRDIKHQRAAQQSRTRQLALSAIVLIILAGLLLVPMALLGMRGLVIKHLDSKVRRLEPQVRVARDFKEKIQTIEDYISVKQSCMEILREVSLVVSGDVIIERFSFDKNESISIVGEAGSHSSVVNLSRALRESPLLTNAVLKYTRKKDRLKENVDFEIMCQLEP